jgi:hypothetical protein
MPKLKAVRGTENRKVVSRKEWLAADEGKASPANVFGRPKMVESNSMCRRIELM